MTLQGAIKQLHELRCNEDMPVFFKPVIAEVINVLLMDAEEVRHGWWLEHQEGRWIYAKCSICNTVHNTTTNYCPNCGAIMEREEDE